jgi:hypothetical protein
VPDPPLALVLREARMAILQNPEPAFLLVQLSPRASDGFSCLLDPQYAPTGPPRDIHRASGYYLGEVLLRRRQTLCDLADGLARPGYLAAEFLDQLGPPREDRLDLPLKPHPDRVELPRAQAVFLEKPVLEIPGRSARRNHPREQRALDSPVQPRVRIQCRTLRGTGYDPALVRERASGHAALSL